MFLAEGLKRMQESRPERRWNATLTVDETQQQEDPWVIVARRGATIRTSKRLPDCAKKPGPGYSPQPQLIYDDGSLFCYLFWIRKNYHEDA